MIPVYQATDFIKVLDGGTTRPWLVIVKVSPEDVDEYVVKIFSNKDMSQTNYVAKELVCSVLAREFDLFTPDSALIEFSDLFIQSLPVEIKETLLNKDSRIKFGTKYISPNTPYSPALRLTHLKQFDLETIYAFDNLILNVDRCKRKPNLYFSTDDCFLIDHERSLEGTKYILENFKKNIWVYRYEEHLFYRHLKNLYKKRADSFFDTFLEYLNGVDLDILDAEIQQIKYFKHNIEEYIHWKNYLCQIQQFSTKFTNLLKRSLE